MIGKITRILALLVFSGWASAANASLIQELYFYFEFTEEDLFELPPPPSQAPIITLTFPTECGVIGGTGTAECPEAQPEDIGVEIGAYDESTHFLDWGSFALVDGEWIIEVNWL